MGTSNNLKKEDFHPIKKLFHSSSIAFFSVRSCSGNLSRERDSGDEAHLELFPFQLEDYSIFGSSQR